MKLSVKKRQEYLKTLGFYEGKIDGKEGPLTKKSYKNLQKKYFKRAKDIDGKYGNDTDILLRNAYNVYKYCKSFELKNFKCHCGTKYCTGYPAVLSTDLLKNLQMVMNEYKAVTITSPLRCKTWNSKQTGSSKTSKHISGKALDIVTTHKGLEDRKNLINYWFTLKNPNYGYCDGYYKTKTKSGKISAGQMGSATHLDVK